MLPRNKILGENSTEFIGANKIQHSKMPRYIYTLQLF